MAGNANSGKHRSPMAKLKLHGSYRADRHGQRFDDSTMRGGPDKPAFDNADAEWLWQSHVERMAAAGVVKGVDAAHVWSLCELWGLYRTAYRAAQADPIDKNARIAVVSYWAAFSAAAAKCGLTPVDRAKLSADPQRPADEFEAEIA